MESTTCDKNLACKYECLDYSRHIVAEIYRMYLAVIKMFMNLKDKIIEMKQLKAELD